MNRSVKIFMFQLATTFVVAITLSIFIGEAVKGKSKLGEEEVIRGAMAIGGLVASLLLTMYGGWKGLAIKPLLLIAGIITGLFSGNPVTVIVGLIAGSFLYLLMGKVRAYLRGLPASGK